MLEVTQRSDDMEQTSGEWHQEGNARREYYRLLNRATVASVQIPAFVLAPGAVNNVDVDGGDDTMRRSTDETSLRSGHSASRVSIVIVYGRVTL